MGKEGEGERGVCNYLHWEEVERGRERKVKGMREREKNINISSLIFLISSKFHLNSLKRHKIP